MPTVGYLIISICLIAFFVVLFFVTFVINRKTPVPKGCEHIKISEENCSMCNNTSCTIKEKLDIQLQKIKDDLDNEEEIKEEE